jgi:fluoroquinolone transport system permease protein
MNRFSSVLKWDAVLQWRAGFYYMGFFVTIAWIALLSGVPHDSLKVLLPPFMLLSLNITTYYFIAGLVLFEKGEGILNGLVVTPLQEREYLLSKTVTLTALAVVESVLIILFSYGVEFSVIPLISGMISMSVIYALIGFVMVARYDSINQYLLPSSLFVGFLQAPWLFYFGIIENPLFYLFPTQGPLLLLKWGFEPITQWDAIYAVGYSLVWIAISYYLARKAFFRFVVKPQGGG